MSKHPFLQLLITFIIMHIGVLATAGEIRVAVASNFSSTIKVLQDAFEKNHAHKVILSIGSTGKQYAQIINGAPFDIFFAADSKRPLRLEQDGYAIAGSRFTYALGKLILWSPKPSYIDSTGNILKQSNFRYLAIANPKLAPYGKAAQEVLQAQGIWYNLKSKIVRGENINQTFQFVKSGNAELGFIAYSQITHDNLSGSWWQVPQSLYSPIKQQAVALKSNPATQAFIRFLKSDKSLEIIRSFGYGTP